MSQHNQNFLQAQTLILIIDNSIPKEPWGFNKIKKYIYKNFTEAPVHLLQNLISSIIKEF